MNTLADADGRIIYQYNPVTGKHEHIVRQSTLGDMMDCAERTRYNLYREVQRQENDAAAAGTGVHAGIECAVESVKGGYEPIFEECLHRAVETVEAINITKWAKFASWDDLRRQVGVHLGNWWDQILPTLDPVESEWKFSIPMYEDDERVIVAEGTVDYIDRVHPITDWKTAGRAYQRHEKQKSAIQPRMYTWARTQATGRFHGGFQYVVMINGTTSIQKLPISVTTADWKFMEKKALAYARLVESNLPVWPLNDASYLCSEKWCSAFHLCKGAV